MFHKVQISAALGFVALSLMVCAIQFGPSEVLDKACLVMISAIILGTIIVLSRLTLKIIITGLISCILLIVLLSISLVFMNKLMTLLFCNLGLIIEIELLIVRGHCLKSMSASNE